MSGVVAEWSFDIAQGADYPNVGQFEWRSGTANPTTGVVPLVDLTGYTAAMKARPSYDSPTVALSLTDGAGITLGGPLGTVNVTITSAQAAAMPAGTYVHDLFLTAPGGTKTMFLAGRIRVKARATY